MVVNVKDTRGNFILKIQVVAKNTANNFTRLFFAAPGRCENSGTKAQAHYQFLLLIFHAKASSVKDAPKIQ